MLMHSLGRIMYSILVPKTEDLNCCLTTEKNIPLENNYNYFTITIIFIYITVLNNVAMQNFHYLILDPHK